IGDVDDRGAVELRLPGQRIDRLGNGVAAAVMPDIGDVAIALVLDDRLVGAARLKVAVADQPHVARLRRIADLLALRRSRGGERDATCEKRQSSDCRSAMHEVSSRSVFLAIARSE